jgi:predicted DNA-binding WGR domain protein
MTRKDTEQNKKRHGNWETPPSDFSYILFERVELTENANRFYYLSWQPSLLHPKAVVRMYGRKGETQRMITPQPFDSLEAAWPLMRSIIKARLRHGYQVVQPDRYREPLCKI